MRAAVLDRTTSFYYVEPCVIVIVRGSMLVPPQVERLFEMSWSSLRCLLLEARRRDAVLQSGKKAI